ncbi:MAG: ATP phosphoribosyltransferase regulatory subunit, partial [Gammaproteobacteria bacterium]|nr:ATP phosphoribosyltransferase regulatory subunit [Gammaproteobacteria bacterium]
MLTSQSRWLLPDGVDEQLPPEAARMEQMRAAALSLFARWGYQLCMPPLVEFLDSLLSGVGEDLETQTFKLTDQISGRMLGIPADITPQIARIDAHRLPVEGPQRLCYLGPILHTLPEKFAGSRNPLQVGAELYGYAGIEADAEVQSLMLALLAEFGIREVTLELCHMEIFRGLSRAAALDPAAESALLDALLRKDRAEVDEVVATVDMPPVRAEMFRALLRLHGGTEVIAQARQALREAPAEVTAAVETLSALVGQIERRTPSVDVHVDLAELRGYHYHTGIMFGAYTPSLGRAIAWGGRYDNVGAWFGRARPATGFSA